MISGLELWLQYFSRSVFLMTHWWTLPSSWDLGLGSSPSHYGTPTPRIKLFMYWRSWFPWDFAFSWDLWNQALGRSVKGPWASYKPESAKFCPLPGSTLVRFSVFFWSKISLFFLPKIRTDESHKANFFWSWPISPKDPWAFSASWWWRQQIDMCRPPYRPWETDWQSNPHLGLMWVIRLQVCSLSISQP